MPQRTGELRTPLVSCVLFLADGRDGDAAAAVVGGPTLVLDQRVTVLTEGEEDEEGEEEEQVMMVEPASGSVGCVASMRGDTGLGV